MLALGLGERGVAMRLPEHLLVREDLSVDQVRGATTDLVDRRVEPLDGRHVDRHGTLLVHRARCPVRLIIAQGRRAPPAAINSCNSRLPLLACAVEGGNLRATTAGDGGPLRHGGSARIGLRLPDDLGCDRLGFGRSLRFGVDADRQPDGEGGACSFVALC